MWGWWWKQEKLGEWRRQMYHIKWFIFWSDSSSPSAFPQVSAVDSVTRLLSVSSSVEHAAFYRLTANAALIWLEEWRVLSSSLLNGCFKVGMNPNVINPPGNKSLKRLPPPPICISTGEAVLGANNCYIYIWAQTVILIEKKKKKQNIQGWCKIFTNYWHQKYKLKLWNDASSVLN